MLYDGWLSLDLPATLGPPLPTDAMDGLERLLFTGRWRRRVATCTLSTAVVLARVHAVLRAAGAERFVVDDDATELVALRIGSETWGAAPPRWAERMPTRWLEEPCAFRLRATWTRAPLCLAAQVRYLPRHDPEVGGLVATLRGAWDVPDTDAPKERLLATFDDPGALSRLQRIVGDAGTSVCAEILAGLRRRFDTAGAHRGSAVILSDLAAHAPRYAELVHGLPAHAVAGLACAAEAAALGGGAWDALDHRGVPGRLARGRFETVAEVDHVV